MNAKDVTRVAGPKELGLLTHLWVKRTAELLGLPSTPYRFTTHRRPPFVVPAGWVAGRAWGRREERPQGDREAALNERQNLDGLAPTDGAGEPKNLLTS